MGYTVIDFETTGLNAKHDQVIEIGAVKLDENFNEVGTFGTFVSLRGLMPLPDFITELTGITKDHLRGGMSEEEAFDTLAEFIGHDTVVAQYAPFDLAFLHERRITPGDFICTKSLSAQLEPEESSSLGDVCKRLGIELENAHRALDDAKATAEVLKYRLVEAQGRSDVFMTNTITVSDGRTLRYIPLHTDKITLKGGGLLADLRLNVKEMFE